MKKALVFGANGQAGSYMCEFLLDKGYSVVGTVRGPAGSACSLHYISERYKMFRVRYLIDVRKNNLVESALFDGRSPYDEVYNMTGQMFAPASWDDPSGYLEVNGLAPLLMLNAIRRMPSIKFFNAGSAGVFAQEGAHCFSESSPRGPKTPYDCAKHFAEVSVKAFREKYGVFACTGIFFNAESDRRKKTFFAQKVAYEVVRIAKQIAASEPITKMHFGKLSAVRDWGWAPEYVEAVWLMLQAEKPVDYVIGTGSSYSCKEFVETALNEVGVPLKMFDDFVEYDKEPGETDALCSNPKKIADDLGWVASVKMHGIVKKLVEAETWK